MGNKKDNFKKPGLKTLSIHHGKTFAEDTGCVMPPIFSTSTFKHGNKAVSYTHLTLPTIYSV